MTSYRNSETRPPIMAGSPPARVVPQLDWDRPPWNRWAFHHVRELVPTAEVWRGSGHAKKLPRDERDLLVESRPKVFYVTDHYRDYPMVLIRLSKAKRAMVEPLLRRQWRTLASKAAVRAFEAR